jgi:hypothetical protein
VVQFGEIDFRSLGELRKSEGKLDHYHLVVMGRAVDLTGAGAAYATLEQLIRHLLAQLTSFAASSVRWCGEITG